MIVGVGKALAELTAILLGVGLIIGAFSQTGVGSTLVNDLVFPAGDSTIVLLLMEAINAFIFGMEMTVRRPLSSWPWCWHRRWSRPSSINWPYTSSSSISAW